MSPSCLLLPICSVFFLFYKWYSSSYVFLFLSFFLSFVHLLLLLSSSPSSPPPPPPTTTTLPFDVHFTCSSRSDFLSYAVEFSYPAIRIIWRQRINSQVQTYKLFFTTVNVTFVFKWRPACVDISVEEKAGMCYFLKLAKATVEFSWAEVCAWFFFANYYVMFVFIFEPKQYFFPETLFPTSSLSLETAAFSPFHYHSIFSSFSSFLLLLLLLNMSFLLSFPRFLLFFVFFFADSKFFFVFFFFFITLNTSMKSYWNYFILHVRFSSLLTFSYLFFSSVSSSLDSFSFILHLRFYFSS